MLDKFLADNKFVALMTSHCYDVIKMLTNGGIEFNIVVHTKFVNFNPPLPEEFGIQNHALSVFALAGYTFESISLEKDKLFFEAGFGPDDYETLVSLNLAAINQIQVENSVIFVNFSLYKGECDKKHLTQNSKKLFLNNPNNKNLKK
ncbi:hypothetical protein FMM56_07890 [Campylobacter sp. LR264d]|uniref:hypothetical protein n=1 Tax=unclassified Campylobacter TaxID=2593542 RepID=UPI00123C5DAF|nr:MULTISPECIES: hypothetical protein [unclassified Campylobacter]KAA6227023.1 hypothetical protein FMM55_03470 [Campylobacter sp. LR196d]KAA6229459.1 hypothetical protein FMM56_07890 [Campylobacter sp. LR264d]